MKLLNPVKIYSILGVLLFFSCSTTPKEMLVGDWANDAEGIEISFTADGIFTGKENGEGEDLTYILENEDPLVFLIYLDETVATIRLEFKFVDEDQVLVRRIDLSSPADHEVDPEEEILFKRQSD